jgi:hypothetical protein
MQTDLSDQISTLIDGSAPPITLAELTSRAAAGPWPESRRAAPGRPAPPRHRRRQGRAVLAGAATAAVLAAGGAVALTAGHPARPDGPTGAGGVARPGQAGAAHAGQPATIRLTAARVRRIEKASTVAMASAGHVRVAWSSTDEGIPDGSGTLSITFSGRDFNSVSFEPASKVGTFTQRVVDGQDYSYFELAPGQRPRWYHSVNQTSGGQAVPDPRGLLTALQPAAAFVQVGRQVIGGVPCQELRATRVNGLPSATLSLGLTSGEPLTGLQVWVDSRGIVRQLAEVFSGPDQQGNFTVNKQTISFLDIGQPETIVAPRHYLNQVTHG